MAKKLWQCMLAGCDIRGQAYDALFDTENDPDGSLKAILSCALGAAIEGAYHPEDPRGQEKMLEQLRCDYPVLTQQYEWTMGTGDDIDEVQLSWTLETIVVDANDKKHWTRERIAMEIIKPKEEAEDVDSAS